MGPREHALIIDAGDFLGGDTDQDALKGEFLIRGLRTMGIGAMNLGEMDFLRGQAYLRHLEQGFGAPLISANILLRDSRQPFVSRYRILRVGGREWLGRRWGGLRVAVFGLISNELPPRRARPEDQALLILDPVETARQMIAELRPKCDLLVALTHLGLAASEELASACPEIDIVVSGHGRLRLDGMRQVGPTILLHSRSEGKFISDLAITVTGRHEIGQSQAVQLPLDETIPEDPELAALYDEYHSSLRARRAAPAAGAPLYAGAAACASCHQDEYRQWSGSIHARALESLSGRGEEHNPECLPCHVTGYGQPGGFYDPVATPGLTGVQCESCHGPALSHAQFRQPGARGSPPPPLPAAGTTEECRRCHDETQDPDFTLVEDLPLVTH